MAMLARLFSCIQKAFSSGKRPKVLVRNRDLTHHAGGMRENELIYSTRTISDQTWYRDALCIRRGTICA
jgi:hypothetical protein